MDRQLVDRRFEIALRFSGLRSSSGFRGAPVSRKLLVFAPLQDEPALCRLSSGFGRIAMREIRCQLPDEKFLKKIGAGACTDPDQRVFKR